MSLSQNTTEIKPDHQQSQEPGRVNIYGPVNCWQINEFN